MGAQSRRLRERGVAGLRIGHCAFWPLWREAGGVLAYASWLALTQDAVSTTKTVVSESHRRVDHPFRAPPAPVLTSSSNTYSTLERIVRSLIR